MNSVVLHYPETLPDMLNETKEELEKDFKMALAVKFFEMKRISSGTAAELAGVDRVTFLFSLKKYGVSMSNFEENELAMDIENA